MKQTTVARQIVILLAAAIPLVSDSVLRAGQQVATDRENHSFHNSLPSRPLPPTLDPVEFTQNRAAFVAHSLAARIKPTLYQVPCYCGCDRELGHRSLLDCFTGRHGVFCHTCQKEVVFCYLQHRKGRTAAQMRTELKKGRPSTLAFNKYIEHYYRELSNSYK